MDQNELLMRLALAGVRPTAAPARPDLAGAALGAASAMLAPNLSRFPISGVQRLGLALGGGLRGMQLGRAIGELGGRQSAVGRKRSIAAPKRPRKARLSTPAARRQRLTSPTAVAAVAGLHRTAPPILPGGWVLYGTHRRTGKPVYRNRSGMLRVLS